MDVLSVAASAVPQVPAESVQFEASPTNEMTPEPCSSRAAAGPSARLVAAVSVLHGSLGSTVTLKELPLPLTVMM